MLKQDNSHTVLHTAVESSYNIIAGYEALADSGKMSRDDAQRAAIEAVRSPCFGGGDGKTEYLYI
jgi:methyl-accepting chemotaxis protein